MAKRPDRTPATRPPSPLVPPIDVSDLKTYPLRKRHSKVQLSDLATPWQPGGSFTKFYAGLPDILAVKTLRTVARAITRAHRQGRPVIAGVGAHVIKVGLSPIVTDLMQRGIITAVAMNGAGIIHDFELALMGHTSEEVDAEIDDGRFGMAEETGRILNEAISQGAAAGEGLGEAIGNYLNQHAGEFPNRATSILATGARLGLPVTVHVALGTDIIHMHPLASGAALGEGSLRDFKYFASSVSRLAGGVYVNCGSAVVLPEVFLKAVALARNQGVSLAGLTTVNIDFLRHYRPITNVVTRPTARIGNGYALTGHHEIMIPLLAAALVEEGA